MCAAGTAAPARRPRDFLTTLCPEEVKRNGRWGCNFGFGRLKVKEENENKITAWITHQQIMCAVN